MNLSNQDASQQNLMTDDEYAQLPSSLYLAEDVRELDRFAIEECGIDGFELMTKAARFAFHTLVKTWPKCDSLIVLCGSGNNAGDGYIMAALAHKRGMVVSVFYASPPERLKGDAREAYLSCQQQGVTCLEFAASTFQQHVASANTVIVDALLGTGLNTEVRGNYAEMIQAANTALRPIFAVDVPSGLCSNTGQVLGLAIRASVTATFIALKLGLFTGHGREYAGRICFSRLELGSEILDHRPAVATRLDLNKLLSKVRARARSTHKGQCGHVMIIGGDIGFGGAVIMASKAAARMGAGLSSVITQASHRTALLSNLPEAMVHSPENLGEIEQLLRKADVIVIGPGLGQSAWSEKMLFAALNAKKPLVLDADALNLLAHNSNFQQLIHCAEEVVRANYVFTPHPGEAARLLMVSSESIQSDRLNSLKALHAKWGGNILLKGSGSLIITQQEQLSLCPYGNPGMASGGMGDVLSGLIGGLMAQGFEAGFALELAASLHARAADITSEADGERGLLASDLIPLARQLLNVKYNCK